ncbi:MAG TPA: TIGR04255 family protein [Steroidobacteraceae bacterium]|nr:TIGR04255 family protein [Steroidobacteraceae bacterium]
MATIQHLSRAPITEAIVEVQVRFGDDRAPETFERLAEALARDYPQKELRRRLQVQFDLAANKVDPSEGTLGYLFRSRDGAQVVQSTREGFSFSRLTPYENWNAMFGEAWRLWLVYREMFAPISVRRLSVRYINRLNLPGPELDFDDYLTSAPRLPEGMGYGVSSFTTAVVMPDAKTRTSTILRQVFDGPGAEPTIVPVILDIDVVREVSLDPSDDAAIRTAFSELRALKNQAFFGSLTQKCVELFK